MGRCTDLPSDCYKELGGVTALVTEKSGGNNSLLPKVKNSLVCPEEKKLVLEKFP